MMAWNWQTKKHVTAEETTKIVVTRHFLTWLFLMLELVICIGEWRGQLQKHDVGRDTHNGMTGIVVAKIEH